MLSRSVNQTHPEEVLTVHLVNPFNEFESLNQIAFFTKLKEIKRLKYILVTLSFMHRISLVALL